MRKTWTLSRAATSLNCRRRQAKGQGEHFKTVYCKLRTTLTKSRVRGYQFRSEGPGEAKKNPTAFNTYDSSGVETPVAPDASEDAGDLEGKGFAEKDA